MPMGVGLGERGREMGGVVGDGAEVCGKSESKGMGCAKLVTITWVMLSSNGGDVEGKGHGVK